MVIHVDDNLVMAAVYGGAVLGGGGGGSLESGLALGRLALERGGPQITELDSLEDDDLLVTVGAVGAPAAAGRFIEPMHYVEAVQLLIDHCESPIKGIISNENGGLASINGWLQSAVLGMPLVDAPCNGRAHPIGIMGAIGLERIDGFIARHGVVGGDPNAGRHIRMYIEGTVASTAGMVRQASVTAGGFVADARNPVTVAYARQNAAPGALRQAIKVGQALLSAPNPKGGAMAVCNFLGGEMVCRGSVERYSLRTQSGLDVGFIRLSGGYELTFWNEYMTLERNGERLATFPDLIATMSATDNIAVPSAQVSKGQELFVISVPRGNLILGAGMKSVEALNLAERAVDRNLLMSEKRRTAR